MKWNNNEIEELISYFNLGFSYSEISIKLNRTSDSIRNKLFKLGLKFTDVVDISKKEIKKKCENCSVDFKSFERDNRKFCSHSCSAIFNNFKRSENYNENCKYCNNEIKKGNEFCNNICYAKYHTQKIYELIEKNGNVSEKQIKSYLIYKHGTNCMECGWNKIHPILNKVPIQLEHIDGNSDNNTKNNCKLLCPNCHSLTLTFGALNIGNGRTLRKIKRKKYREILK